jgi:hypothetical protein
MILTTTEATMYEQVIREEAAKAGLVGQVDPRHVEGWMRLEYGTLNHLPRETFAEYVQVTLECEKEAPGSSEQLAQSFGL